jgi:hypothetical protein
VTTLAATTESTPGATEAAPSKGGSRRRRLPKVGEQVSHEGSPSLAPWASCISLADLQRALDLSRLGASPNEG